MEDSHNFLAITLVAQTQSVVNPEFAPQFVWFFIA